VTVHAATVETATITHVVTAVLDQSLAANRETTSMPQTF